MRVFAETGSDPDRSAGFREAMRHLAGGVAIITAGQAEGRVGLTATAVTSLSADPPTLLVCINRSASLRPVLDGVGHFAVNLLGDRHQALADRFAGRHGVAGHERFARGRWSTLATGAPVLADALAAFDCAIDEIIERQTHAIVIGRVEAVRIKAAPALVYWRGGYERLVEGGIDPAFAEGCVGG
jgi:flavin reductase (DIM6/NTAB) family NADH-FMN oxidoreductase RutF